MPFRDVFPLSTVVRRAMVGQVRYGSNCVFFKKKQSHSGGSTRSGVPEKIRHNFAALGLRHLFRFFLALRSALSGWVTRALQGKVLVVMGVGRLACVAGH